MDTGRALILLLFQKTGEGEILYYWAMFLETMKISIKLVFL